MKHKIIIVLWLSISLFIGGCSTTKNAKKSHSIESFEESEYVERVLSDSKHWQALTARMTFEVALPDKGATKLNGNIRIKRDEVIQLSLSPVLGIEIGRAEITPKGLLVIDRINKRYVKVSFEEIKTLTRVDVGFELLQALFLNEMYVPDKHVLTLRDFYTDLTSEEMLWRLKKGKPIAYSFITQVPSGWLTRSHISLYDTSYGVDWEYADFQKLDDGMFPTRMNAAFGGSKQRLTIGLELSRLAQNNNWDSNTKVSSRYKKVELSELIEILF